MTDPPVEQELVERYVLGRATPEERSRLDKLVGESPAWRDALRSELALVEGVRREGRHRMKERLRARLAAPSRSTTPWTRILTAAAVVVVVAGIAVLNRWLPTTEEEGLQDIMAEDTGQTVEEERNETAAPAPETLSLSPNGELDAARAKRPARQRTDDVLQSAPGATAGRKEEFAVREAPRAEAKDERRFEAGERLPLTWATGTEFPGTGLAGSDPSVTAAKKAVGQSAMEATVQEESARSATVEGDKPDIRISQAPHGVAQKYRDRPDERRQFAVSFAQTGDVLEVTLYLDNPLDTSTLNQASVESFPPDSLVIQAGSRTFGVRIPEAVTHFRNQQRLQLKQDADRP